MSFGGSVSAMIYSLKYNNSLLYKKRFFREYKKYLQEESNKRLYSKTLYDQNIAPDKEEVRKVIAQIKNEMRARNKKIKRNQGILLSVILILLIVLTVVISQFNLDNPIIY